MGSPSVFGPLGASVTLAAPSGSSSGSTTLPGAGGFVCKVINESTAPVTIGFSGTAGAAVAVVAGPTINAGVSELVAMPFGTVDFALYGVGGTGSVVVQRGDGI